MILNVLIFIACLCAGFLAGWAFQRLAHGVERRNRLQGR